MKNQYSLEIDRQPALIDGLSFDQVIKLTSLEVKRVYNNIHTYHTEGKKAEIQMVEPSTGEIHQRITLDETLSEGLQFIHPLADLYNANISSPILNVDDVSKMDLQNIFGFKMGSFTLKSIDKGRYDYDETAYYRYYPNRNQVLETIVVTEHNYYRNGGKKFETYMGFVPVDSPSLPASIVENLINLA